MSLPRSPFKGLASFGDAESDRHFFFGRERESEVVAANLMASRLTVLYGPSGVGKSSLLRAGVAQRLRSLATVGAGEDSVSEVAIVDSWRDDPISAVVVAAGAPNDVPLADALAERAITAGGELYLILDQMEEYVLYHGREGGPLAGALEDVLTRSDLPVHVLLGVRDDSLADLDALKRRLPGLFANLLRLDHLTRAAARSAIEGPLRAYAEAGGPEVIAEGELVDTVLDQVAAGRIEQHLAGRSLVDEAVRERRVEAPYLQLVLERLWDVERGRGSSVLRASTLAELGGAEQIVEEHLERSLSGLTPGERDVVAELFDHLVTPSGTKIAHAVDDLARYADENPRVLEPVLARLDAARILRRVPGRGGGPPRWEIFHDVLAAAVLAWRTRHEAGRAIERERAAARRRHRRFALLATAALVALAGTSALALWALSQRSEAREKAVAAERGALAAKARELEANAILQLDRDPELGLALAVEAARLAPTAATADIFRRALRDSRVRTVVRLGSPVRDLAALPDGTVAAVVDGGGVRLVKGNTIGPVVVASRKGAQSWLSGRNVLTLRVRTLTARTLPEGSVVASLKVPMGTRYATAGPQLNRFVAAGRLGALVLGRDGRVLARLPHPATVNRATISPNGLLIATAGWDGDAIVWDGAGRRVRTFEGPADRAYDVGFDHLSRLLVVASSDSAARVYSVPSGERKAVFSLHGNQVWRARFGDNQDLVLTASRDFTARTWKVEASAPRARFAGHEGPVVAAIFLPGDRIATGGDDGTVRTWVAQLQPPLLPARGRPAPEPTRDRRATIDGAVVRLENGVELVGHRAKVLSVEFSPDGRRVVTASRDGDARIWNARTGDSKVLNGHGGTVFDASFSPDGTWVVTGGPATAGLWLARTGERWYFLSGDDKPVRAAEFVSPRRIVTLGGDGVRSYVCDVCGGVASLVAVAEARLKGTGRELTQAERLTYLGER